MIVAHFANTGQENITVAPTLNIESELPVIPEPDGRSILIGPSTTVILDRSCAQTERTETG